MRTHILVVSMLWILLTAISYLIVLNFTPFPVAASEQAHLIDDAFTKLTLLSVPVFTFVVAVLLYSGFRFRSRGAPTTDGPPVRGHRVFVVIWLVVTAGLTGYVIVDPGITGLQELRAYEKREPDLVIQVDGRRFFWDARYLDEGVRSRRELVLPIDKLVLFKINSFDVIHSVWIPAFRVKIDAVPGMTTSMVVVPDRLGTMEEDANYRLQCAELCGAGHATMQIPVRVVTEDEFEAWIAEQSPIPE